jgi:fused signal recognition particle receptor
MAPSPVGTARPLAAALANTRQSFFGRLKAIFSRQEAFAGEELEALEEILYTSDLGPQTVQRLLTAVQERALANMARPGVAGSEQNGTGASVENRRFASVRTALREEMLNIFDNLSQGRANDSAPAVSALAALQIWSAKPAVVIVVGVNGAGKTTTIGKLARALAQGGKRVLVAAGDTFRAAAGDQLKIWTERAQVEIFSPAGVSDPSAVAFDACQMALGRGFDVVIIDTAGRLHTQKNLMEELKKMKRVINKALPGGPHETLLVLDANSGQNALQQAREFHSALEVSGIVLTKLDGTAKGGVAVGLACELGLPIKLIGVGEGIEDLRQFVASEFVNSII